MEKGKSDKYWKRLSSLYLEAGDLRPPSADRDVESCVSAHGDAITPVAMGVAGGSQ